MTRAEIEAAIYEASHNLDYQFVPWSNRRVVEFAIQQVNVALEEAAKATGSWLFDVVVNQKQWGVNETAERIRALKVKP